MKANEDPLIDVPLNIKKIFVMVKAPDGCEVYIPLDNDCDLHAKIKKRALAKRPGCQAHIPVPE